MLLRTSTNIESFRLIELKRAPQSRNRKSVAVLFFLLCFSFMAQSATAAKNDRPRVRGMRLQKLTPPVGTPAQVPLVLEITGEKFGSPPQNVSVKLVNTESGLETDTVVVSAVDDKIVVSARAPLGKYAVKLIIGGAPVDTSSYEMELKKEEEKAQGQATPFEISYETFRSEQYTNLYSLLVTNKSYPGAGVGFSPNPNYMKVEIIPAGATNVTIQPGSNPQQMMVTFLAPDKFEVKGVLVTVYDPNSTLNNGQPLAFATPFKEKPPKADPNLIKINNIEVLSLQRRTGMGRVLIQGSGFGDYDRPPITGDKELLCCLNRPQRAFERDRLSVDDEGEPLNLGESRDGEVCIDIKDRNAPACQQMRDWRERIEERVNVELIPRNPDLRVERTLIMYIDDKVIDVYFEFTHFPGYSQPFRLASTNVTVNKGGVKTAQTKTSDGVIIGSVAGPQTYGDIHDIGLARDKNLEYRYTVLDQKDASLLFGSGIGDRFYVIQLAVVNKGEKKVAVPLSAIQAEIEWAYGEDPKGADVYYEEGPPTISPLSLADISGYFEAFQKSKGRKARLFNALDGLTTLMASLVPLFGPGFEDAHVIFTGGFIPGLRKGIGDLSSLQLQNLTSRSWENIEEIPAKSGKSKFIFIQRGDQIFASEGAVSPSKIKKQIKNIRGLEIIGFEIIQSEERLATQQQ